MRNSTHTIRCTETTGRRRVTWARHHTWQPPGELGVSHYTKAGEDYVARSGAILNRELEQNSSSRCLARCVAYTIFPPNERGCWTLTHWCLRLLIRHIGKSDRNELHSFEISHRIGVVMMIIGNGKRPRGEKHALPTTNTSGTSDLERLEVTSLSPFACQAFLHRTADPQTYL